MSLTLSSTLCFSTQKPAKVIIIGAGLAGLTTAYRLHCQGIESEVYEARNRVGGRIFSAKIRDEVVELGGQNITDGGNAENIQRLIDEFKLEVTECPVLLSHQYFDGEKFINMEKRSFHPDTLQLQLTEACQKADNMRDVLREFFEETDPLYKILKTRLSAYEGDSIEKLSPLYAKTLYHMLLGGICEAHPYEGDNYVNIVSIQGGNALLCQKITECLGSKIHLNMPLKKLSKVQEHYELEFKNGEKTHAEIVVLAIPCSVYSDIVFEETLIPKNRLESIKSVHYGTNAKICVPFSVLPSQKSTFINEHIGSYFANPHTLTLYFTCEAGAFTPDTIFNAYIKHRSMLESGFHKFCPPLEAPDYARDVFLATYTGPVGYSWQNDPYAKGTYSYIAPGQETLLTSLQEENGEWVRLLFAPIDDSLYFAGEHTCTLMDIAGTMEAACESGEKAARMIAKKLAHKSKTIP